MNAPGFTAQASLYSTTRTYGSKRGSVALSTRLIPQQLRRPPLALCAKACRLCFESPPSNFPDRDYVPTWWCSICDRCFDDLPCSISQGGGTRIPHAATVIQTCQEELPLD